MERIKATKGNIYDLIDQWHESDSQQELHEYLGLTIDQYAYWVETDKFPNE